jgi:hypothetical protein
MSIQRTVGLALATAAIWMLEVTPARAQKIAMRPASPNISAPSVGHRSSAHATGGLAKRTRVASSASNSQSGRTPNADGIGGFGAFAGFGGSEGLQSLLNLTPSNGFDYQFVNSINSDLAMKALVDPVTQLEIAQAVRINRALGGGVSAGAYILGGGGYYVPSESDVDQGQAPAPEDAQASQEPAQQQQPQIIVLQQAPQANMQQAREDENAEPQIPDEGQFTLVLNDGKQIQAVAFTHSNDKIIYITPEGGRASIASSDLDADATVRVNQQRGTPLQLPL